MKNDVLSLTIEAVGSEGEGIARREDGYTLFVPGTVPGDRIKALVLKENKSYGYAKLLSVEEPSPHRTESRCGVFGKCGGCTMLTTDYAFQLETKARRVKDALERLGGIENPPVKPCVGSEPCFAYRNKAQYPVAERDGRLTVGFYAPNSHRVVPSDGCVLQNPLITRIVSFAAEQADKLGIRVYNEESGKGCLRHIYVRTGADEALVVLVAAHENKHFVALAEKIVEGFPQVVGVVLNLNPDRTNLILGPKQKILLGRDYMIDKIGHVTYKVHYRSFYQVNPYTTKLLYDEVARACGLAGTETVFDLYCGAGTIGLYLADKAKKVIGVEIVPEAVENARENAKINGITNAEFHCGKAEKVCPELIKAGERADVVVLDPPRKGCEVSLLHAAAGMRPEKIVYVSCNPSTLARDCKILAELGYGLASATPFDQFPHTAHVECVGLMTRRKRDDTIDIDIEFEAKVGIYACLKDGRTIHIDEVVSPGRSYRGRDINKKDLPIVEFLCSDILNFADEICKNIDVENIDVE